MSINPIMLKHFVDTSTQNSEHLSLLHKSIYMILQELHSAYANQLAASLYSETSSSDVVKLLAPPWHCFSAALLNS